MTDRKLQIQVALGAVNNLTRPLNAAQKSSAALAGQIKATRDSVKQLSGQAASFDKLSTASKKTSSQIEKLRRAADAVKSLDNPTQKQIAAVQKWDARLIKLKTTQDGQLQRLTQLRGALKQHGVFVDRNSNATQAATRRNEQYNRTLQAQEQRLKRLASARASYDNGQAMRGELRGAGTSALMTGAAAGAPLMLAVRSYSTLEDAMKGVAKQVDGLISDDGQRTARYLEMQRLIQEAADVTSLPGGSTDYAALIEGGGRMGVVNKNDVWADQRRDLLAFANTAAKASKAFELPAGELSEDLGKIAGLYKIPIKNIEDLGDAINYLDDNAKSKGADIIDVLKRMGGNADRMGYRQSAALGSTLLSLGAEREIAASASNAMVRELSIASIQGNKFFEGLNALSINAGKLEKSMATNAMGTLRSVLESVSKLPETDRLRVLTQLFGKEFGDDAAKLANNLGELDRQLALVEGRAARGSMQRESDIDQKALSTQWGLLKSSAIGAAQSIGERLTPALLDLMSAGRRWMGNLRRWVDQHPVLAGHLIKAAALFAVLSAALGVLLVSLAALMGPFLALRLGLSLLTNGGLLTRAAGNVGLLSRAMTFLRTSAVGLFNAPLNGLRVLGRGLVWLVRSPLKLFGGAFSWVLRGIAALATGLTWPIALAVAALAAAGALIYKYWAPLKVWFSGLFSGLAEDIQKAGAQGSVLGWIFGTIGQDIGRVWLALKRAWTGIGDMFRRAWTWVKDLLEPITLTHDQIDRLAESGRRFGKIFMDAINDLLAPFKAFSNEVTALLEKLKLIPELAERIRLENVRNNTMNGAMPEAGAEAKAEVINIWDAKRKVFVAWPRLPFVGPLPGSNPEATDKGPGAWTYTPPKEFSRDLSGSNGSPAAATAEVKDPNKLGDIVFKNVAPHIALASPYLRAINGLTKATEALRQSTTGLEKFGAIGFGDRPVSYPGIFDAPQRVNLLTQLRGMAVNALARAQAWLSPGSGPQVAFAGPRAVLAPQGAAVSRPASVSVGGNTYNLNFDMQGMDSLDEKKLAAFVKKEIEEVERQQGVRNRSLMRDRD